MRLTSYELGLAGSHGSTRKKRNASTPPPSTSSLTRRRAVETVGTLTRQALKSSQGSDDWLRFFALMGSALAEREGTPPVPDTPTGKKLVAELKAAARALNVEPRLRAYGASLRAIDLPALKGNYYFLMRLVPSQATIHVTGFRQHDLPQASEAYLKAELEIQQEPGAEAVLVSVASLAALRRAYPNYFLDANKFLTAMRTAIGEKSALN